jgi:hypothetical protein
MNTNSLPVATRRMVAATATLLLALSASAETWDGGAGTPNWEDALNWSNDALPASGGTTAQGEAAISNGSAVNLQSAQNINAIRVGSGAGLSGSLNILPGANLNATFANQLTRVGSGNGGNGSVTQSGGATRYHVIQLGLDNGATGAYTLSGGTMVVTREVSGNSLFIGENGAGTLTISGGAFTTRAGVRLGTATTGVGTFRVDGSSATQIGIGSESTLDGLWTQNAGSTLDLRFDAGGVTKIFIDEVGENGGGNVTFANGSLLNVDFMSTSVAGTWTVMEWQGTLTNNGLAFAPGVDTNIWSFAVVGNTLQVTAAAIPEPSAFAALAGLGALGFVSQRRRRAT